ncbi:MAG: hypothetical protein AABX05_01510 [Nanoarchaeota archaeon]
MKLKPKREIEPSEQELEELVQLDDLSRQEERAIVKSDFSRDAYLLRDLRSLAELVNEKLKNERSLNGYKSDQTIPSDPVTYFSMLGSLSGAFITSIFKMVTAPTNTEMLPLLIGFLSGGAIGAGAGYADKRRSRLKLQKKILMLEEAREAIDQELSRYQVDYGRNDLVCVRENLPGDFHLMLFSGSNVLPSMEDIYAIMEPGDYLTEEKIRSLDKQSPIACYQRDALLNYGFLSNVREEGFSLAFDYGLSMTNFSYDFRQLREEEIAARLLVPMLKQSEVTNYRINAK